MTRCHALIPPRGTFPISPAKTTPKFRGGRPGGLNTFQRHQSVAAVNLANPAFENIDENQFLVNRETWIAAKKNPADAGTSNGAYNCGSYREQNTPKRTRVARALGFALTLGTFEAWRGFGFILAVRLSRKERAALAYAALTSLSDEDGYRVASAALFGTFQGEAHA